MNDNKETLLIKRFNKRENLAFGEIYSLLYKELFFFTSKLYQNTNIDANDVLHDIFIKLWELNNLKFDGLVNVKAYMYISIKNYLKNSVCHKKTVDKYVEKIMNDNDYFIIQVAEIETYSLLSDVIDSLPTECAKVFKLYVDGWSIKEIAQKLGKTESTVYTQRQDAISIVKRKLKNDKLFSLLF